MQICNAVIDHKEAQKRMREGWMNGKRRMERHKWIRRGKMKKDEVRRRMARR